MIRDVRHSFTRQLPLMRHILTLIAAVLSSVAVLAQPSTLSWGTEQSCNTSAEGSLRPRIAINANGDPVVIWGRASTPANFTSVGDGTGFSTPVMIHPMAVSPSVADWMGSSIAASGNTVWAVFKALPEESAPCYVVRSDDGGFTWGDTLRMDPFDGHVSRFPSIDVANGAEPVIEYMQFGSGFADPRQVVTRMMGGVFMGPVQVSTPFAPGEVCDCCPGQVIADGGDVFALYRNNASNIRTIWGASSTDAGASFPIGAELDPTAWNIGACPSSGPDAYLAGDSLRYVWMSGAVGGTKVYIGTAHSPELTTGISERISGVSAAVQQNYPRIAGNADTLGVVWQQTTAGNADILFSWSTTGVAGLSEPDTVNTDPAGQQKTPDIAFANGAFHIVWQDAATGTVKYRKAVVTDATGLPELGRPALHVWPVPASDLLHVEGLSPGMATLRVIDAIGRTMVEVAVSDALPLGNEFANGSYRLLGVNAHGACVASAAFSVVR